VKKIIIGLIGVLLLSGNMVGCTNMPLVPPPITGSISFASDYNMVRDKISELHDSDIYDSGYRFFSSILPSSSFPPSVFAENAVVTASSNDNYSKTNVQVEGIDEADIVITDGKFIYSLQSGVLYIFQVEGNNSKLITQYRIVENESNTPWDFQPTSLDDKCVAQYEYAIALYICQNNVIVLTQYCETMYVAGKSTYQDYNTNEYNSYYFWQSNYQTAICQAYVLDVTNPQTPQKVHTIGQDGYYLSSRLNGSTLYLLSTHYVYSFDAEDLNTFVPATYDGNDRMLVEPSNIAIMPYAGSSGYTIVSAIDVNDGRITANQSMLGAGSLVYMSENSLYISGYECKTIKEEQRYILTEVVECTEYTSTNITRLDISKNNLKIVAHGCVNGTLLNQFAMDEYDGYLRIVSTSMLNRYSIYTDVISGNKEYSWDNTQSPTNGLYIFNMSLELVGAVDKLAAGETVYSVRFDGDIGYFVTFRRIDPLFAVDLSKPTQPKVLSALKIPGFSQYLHVYTDGLLFGLGYDADLNGFSNSLKLSMFDTSDTADVAEAHTLVFDKYYSSALYNHKAILVDANKNIIAFPADSEYLIFGYDVTNGFYKKASVKLDNWQWSNDSRGFYINDYFYVVASNSVAIIDLNSFALVRTIKYGDAA